MLCASCFRRAIGARYDAFASEVIGGLDYVAVETKEIAPDGELGRAVYETKVKDDFDLFIPTDNYVRIGLGSNIGELSSSYDRNGGGAGFSWGVVETVAFGWNLSSWVRSEITARRQEMRFNGAAAGVDTIGGGLIFDLVPRWHIGGDVHYRRAVVPFIGIGASVGWADFGGGADRGWTDWRDSPAYGVSGQIGLSFAFSDTNALDLAVGCEQFWRRNYLDLYEKPGNMFAVGSVVLSWRASF